jgi:ceramide glucosyltransferase
VKPPAPVSTPPVSILTPLSGIDDGLEANLRAAFAQDYPDFEILFAAPEERDPAVAVARKLMAEHPAVPSRLIVTGESPYANRKVYSLERMQAEARYDLLVMNDSDIRIPRNMLRVAAAEFQDDGVGLATCPYRAVPAPSLWSVTEALGLNTHFLAGVLTARKLEGMKFALGPSIVARRSVIEEIGGWSRLKDYLAEDFVLGNLAHKAGHRVLLSSCRVLHFIGGAGFRATMAHRIRWARSTRRSRPKGYYGEVFTSPLLPVVACLLWRPDLWPLAALTTVLRGVSAWCTASWVLEDPLFRRRWWLLPVEELLKTLVWIIGFAGNHVVWRGHKYYLHRDGQFHQARR